ncbi:MAG: hypothetical protein MAG451_02318 [Anaerolineales bacterium]|nr:hypothetical protein [Anaerolineales bacterium]
MDLHTFSIAARCSDEGSFGVAVSTARPNVGSLVPFVSFEGAIATQARVNTDLGGKGLALLQAGVSIEIALETLLQTDPGRELRQLHGVDTGGAFAFTGEECVEWAGHHIGDDFTVAGNMLAGPEVVEAMAAAFEASEDLELSERLVRALEAGQEAGGDKRGKQSAALLVAGPEPRLYHNLRVDDHADPVAELRRVYEVCVEQSRQIEQEYGREGLRLFSRIKF